MTNHEPTFETTPTQKIDTQKIFGVDAPWPLNGFAQTNEWVPSVDSNYNFDTTTTQSILAGLVHNRRVLVQGLHGTGKSSHIEQVAARLNWPCLRLNLDSHISRSDLLGRDAVVLEDGKPVTMFKEGLLPWAMQRPFIIVFDEYDAAQPDILFILQRLLESEGKLTLLEKNIVITPHPYFRIFATSNTVGLGDLTGLYHGTNALNQGQMDRWHIVTTLNGMPAERETAIVAAKVPSLDATQVRHMVNVANMTRVGFKAGDLSSLMSPRTVLSWAENTIIFGDAAQAFKLTYLNKCDPAEHGTLREYYQRCMGVDLVLDEQ
jgi:cobaltochelatase CobS